MKNDKAPIGRLGFGEKGIHLKDYLSVIIMHRWILICTFALVVLSVSVWAFVSTPIYRAHCMLLIEPSKVNLTEFKGVYDPTWGDTGGHLSNLEFLETQFRLIVCRPLLEKTFNEFNFGDMPEFKDSKDPIIGFSTLFSVVPMRRSRLAEVNFEWRDPELAARALDFLVNEYISDYRNRTLGVTREGLSALRQKAEELRPQVEANANELQQFMVKNNMVSLEETQNIVVDRLKEINRNLTDIEKERIEVESDFRSIEQSLQGGVDIDTLPEIARSQTVRDLKLEYIKTKKRYSDLTKSFGPNHPEVKAAQAMLDTIKDKTEVEMISILSAAKSEYDRAIRQERELKGELERQEERVMEFNKQAVRYNVLKNQYEALSKTYNAVAKRIEEIEIATAAGSKGDNIFIITRPKVPVVPVRPRKSLYVALACCFGLALGVGLCFFIEYIDTTVKTKEDAEVIFGVPVIGYIPGIANGKLTESKKGDSEVPTELQPLTEPRSAVSEAFRSIRTALAFSGQDGELKHLLVTSATRSEGKSLSSVNIAITLAQAGKKVLLVDADMRKPRVHKIFRVNPNPGLSNILVGEGAATLDNAFQPAPGVENLYVLPCGPMPPNPAELLNSLRMKELLEDMNSRFDVTVFDTPPLVSVTDAAVLSQYVKNVVMVVRSFSTQRAVISRARDIIAETKSRVLGVVLNNADVPRNGYYGDYYGYYYYGYGDGEDGEKKGKRRLRRKATSRD